MHSLKTFLSNRELHFFWGGGVGLEGGVTIFQSLYIKRNVYMYVCMSDSLFRGKGNQNLLVLRDILITYSAYHQGIVQVTLITDLY